MKGLKKVIAVCAVVGLIGAGSAVTFATTYQTPAEAVAGLTGRTVESVVKERVDTGKNYGTMAKEAGKLSEFQAEMLEMKKDQLGQQVAAGTMTAAQAQSATAAMAQQQVYCDGTGYHTGGMYCSGDGYYCDGTGYGHENHQPGYHHTETYNTTNTSTNAASTAVTTTATYNNGGYGHDGYGHGNGGHHGGGHH